MLPNNQLTLSPIRNKFDIFDTEYFNHYTYKTYDNDAKLCIMRYRENNDNKVLEISRDDGNIVSIPIEITGLINNISLAYDQSNRPIYSYSYTDTTTNISISKFVWFNQLINREETIVIENTSMSYVIIDEIRPQFASISDIVFFYVRRSDSRLCFRYQRDSFKKEYLGPIMTNGEEIAKVGRTNNFRLQLETLKVLYRLIYTYPATFEGIPLLLANGEPLWIVKEKLKVFTED